MKPAILLVEDDPGDRELILIALRAEGVIDGVVVAEDGSEALELLTGGELAPALVLLDLHLPGMDGLEVLARLRGHPRAKSQPVVIFSTCDDETDRFAAYELGANGYARKPVDFVEFGKTVRDLARYWLSVNLPPPRRQAAASGPEAALERPGRKLQGAR